MLDVGDLAVAQFVHDLRNQLTLMLGCADSLASLLPRGEADRQLAELRRCAERGSLLARELLLAARPRVRSQPVDLNRVVESVAAALPHVLGSRLELQLEFAPDALMILASHLELERILLNLVLNARDAIAGEGRITIETAPVTDPEQTWVEHGRAAPAARLTVTDTGCGLTPDVRQRMFEPFFTTKELGTGLGLSSVAFTVKQLHGTVRVESEPGRGTSVSVVLPLAPPA